VAAAEGKATSSKRPSAKYAYSPGSLHQARAALFDAYGGTRSCLSRRRGHPAIQNNGTRPATASPSKSARLCLPVFRPDQK
jgi:hypothetical protein